MSDNPFAVTLTKELAAREELPKSVATLLKFCEGVEESTGSQVLCTLGRGHFVNDGQEWRAVLRSSRGGPPQVMFRAYVPFGGFPVKLDLHQRPPLISCSSNDELVKELQVFLQNPYVVDQIRYFMFFQPSENDSDELVTQEF